VAERLNDELISLWEKMVQDYPERYAAFLCVLKQLRPTLRTPARIFKWWDRLLDPVLEQVGTQRGLAREVMDHTLDLLSVDGFNDPAAYSEQGLIPLVSRLTSRWIDLVSAPPDVRPSTELKQLMLKDALMAFGRKDPKGFMTALDAFVLDPNHRNSALSLLGSFIQSNPPHLHLIQQTPLFGSILQSLQKDESTTTVNLALMVLAMILPFIPSSLVPVLPTLFNIYGRLLFWDRDSSFLKHHTGNIEMNTTFNGTGVPWRKALMSPDEDGHSIEYLGLYFTLLYGLYPLNFVDYIRKPHRYLRHAGLPDELELPADEMRSRSEVFRKQHMLHPNFIHRTIESEKTDTDRWINSGAEEVQADCLALRIDDRPTAPPPHVKASQQHTSPLTAVVDDQDAEFALLRSDTELPHPATSGTAQEPTPVDPAENNPGVPGDSHDHMSPPGSARSVNSLAALSSAHERPGEKGPEQTVAAHAIPLLEESSAGTDIQQVVAMLQRERFRLMNDLQYERFVKEQHMIHMGELRTRQIRRLTTEAEMQSLIMANRSLRQRFDEARRAEAQIKKEFDTRRNMTKKWESDLSTKLRALRDEQKKWSEETSDLRQRLSKAQAECDKLREMVTEAETKKLRAEQDLEAAGINAATVERLRGEIARLSASEREYQGKETRLETAMQEATLAEARARELEREVRAREEEMHRVEGHYRAEIEELRRQLARLSQEQQSRARRQPSDETRATLESVLSASRAKQAALQKQYDVLSRKCVTLEAELLELRCQLEQQQAKTSVEDPPGTPGFRDRRPGSSDADVEGEAGEGLSALVDGSGESGAHQSVSPRAARLHGRGWSDRLMMRF
jgi:hypothetical protein